MPFKFGTLIIFANHFHTGILNNQYNIEKSVKDVIV
jgi:hypothetical protein